MHCLSCRKPQLLILVQMLSGTLQPCVHCSSPCHNSAAGKYSMHCHSCQKPQLLMSIQLLRGVPAAGLSCWRLPLAFLQASSEHCDTLLAYALATSPVQHGCVGTGSRSCCCLRKRGMRAALELNSCWSYYLADNGYYCKTPLLQSCCHWSGLLRTRDTSRTTGSWSTLVQRESAGTSSTSFRPHLRSALTFP